MIGSVFLNVESSLRFEHIYMDRHTLGMLVHVHVSVS